MWYFYIVLILEVFQRLKYFENKIKNTYVQTYIQTYIQKGPDGSFLPRIQNHLFYLHTLFCIYIKVYNDIILIYLYPFMLIYLLPRCNLSTTPSWKDLLTRLLFCRYINISLYSKITPSVMVFLDNSKRENKIK